MSIAPPRTLPSEIRVIQDEMAAIAKSYNLDFFETIFEFVDYEEISMMAAYGGFPVRYPHWRFGAEYDELMKGYSYGLQKIYELVINNEEDVFIVNLKLLLEKDLSLINKSYAYITDKEYA